MIFTVSSAFSGKDVGLPKIHLVFLNFLYTIKVEQSPVTGALIVSGLPEAA